MNESIEVIAKCVEDGENLRSMIPVATPVKFVNGVLLNYAPRLFFLNDDKYTKYK